MMRKAIWKSIPLGDIAPSRGNPMPAGADRIWNVSLEDIESHTGKVLTRQECRVSELGSAKCSFNQRHVLYSKLRPYLNKVVVPDCPGVGTSELIPLLPDSERLDREFLAYYLRSPMFVDFANLNTRGANLPRIDMKALWHHRIPVPTSVEDQRRIVARIKECMARIQEIEHQSQSLRPDYEDLKATVVADNVAELRSRYPESSIGELLRMNADAMRSGPFGSAMRHHEFREAGASRDWYRECSGEQI